MSQPNLCIVAHVRAAVYLRISDDKLGDELGVTRQREDCLKLCEQRGWTVTEVYVDPSVSASNRRKRRPHYDRMVADYKAGKFEALVCWDLDRLTRQPRQLEDWIESAEERGLLLVTANGEADLSTDGGRMFARIKASVSRGEVERKSARQSRAAQQHAEMGRPHGGPLPFGFLSDRIHHHPEQAQAIREAYDALLAGETLASIARRWNAAGLTSGKIRRGRHDPGTQSQWTARSVRGLLLLPRNAGLRAYRGQVVATGLWEPIVPEETWWSAVRFLRSPDRRGRPPGPRHLLSGVALCGVCGHTVVAAHRGSRLRYGHAYRCGYANGHVARRGDHAEQYVSDVVVERLSRADARDLLVDDHRPDVPALRARAVRLRSQIDALAVEFGQSDPEDVVAAAREFRVASAGLRERLGEVEAQLADSGRVNVLGPLVTADDVAATWEGLGVERQRVVIDALMVVRLFAPGRGARVFDPETVGIEWRSE